MNLLAHAFLAGPDIEHRLGNLLADFVKGADRRGLSEGCQLGIRHHQSIDAFTDTHPIVSRSKARLRAYPYVSGILADIFYDHFLSLHWSRFSDEPLDAFIDGLYADLRNYDRPLPAGARLALDHLMADDWLRCYGTVAGIKLTLTRVSKRLTARLGRDFGLARAGSELLSQFDGLRDDFEAFFPLLREHALANRAAPHRGVVEPAGM